MRTLAGIGILAIVIAVGAAVFFFGGFFNVAASEPNPGIVNWALVQVRMASIDRRANVASPVDLDNPEVVRARLRELPRGAGSEVAEVFRRLESRSARPEGDRPSPRARRTLLGHQERHQNDRHAEFRRNRRERHGNLVHRRVHTQAAEHIGKSPLPYPRHCWGSQGSSVRWL